MHEIRIASQIIMANFVLDSAVTPDEPKDPSLDVTQTSMEEDDPLTGVTHEPRAPPASFVVPRFATGGPISSPRRSTSDLSQPASLPSTPTPSRSARFQLQQQQQHSRRHYKKDSMYVLDLYTLTFDEDETVEDVETCKMDEALQVRTYSESTVLCYQF